MNLFNRKIGVVGAAFSRRTCREKLDALLVTLRA